MNGPHAIPDVTTAERRAIYAEFETFLRRGRGGGKKPKLHLPDADGERLCDGAYVPNSDPQYRSVAVATHPPGHFPFCRPCAAQWRTGRSTDAEADAEGANAQ